MRTEAEVATMQCPVCRAPLAMSERQGIEIDYCPQCRGVWLDRGELDKIIERSAPPEQAQAAPAAASARPSPPPQPQAPLHPGNQQSPWDMGSATHGGYGHGDPRHDPRYGGKPYYKKKKHWLSELFDD